MVLLTACDVRVSDKGVSMGVFSGRATDSWTRTYDLSKGSRLEIVNSNGPITVTAATGASVEVKVERELRSDSDEAAMQALADAPVLETASAGEVKVEVRRGKAPGERRRGGQFSSSITVGLPPGLVASFTTENGPVRLEQVDGHLSAATSNGGINGSGLTGAVSATAVNGGIRLDMRSLSDSMELNVVNGGIELLLPPSVKARVKATALNGAVSIDDDLKLISEGDSDGGPALRRVEGALNGGGPLVTAQATNGGVRISASPGERAP